MREALAIWKNDYNTRNTVSALGNLVSAVHVKNSDGTLRYFEVPMPRPVAPLSQQGSNKAWTSSDRWMETRAQLTVRNLRFSNSRSTAGRTKSVMHKLSRRGAATDTACSSRPQDH